MRDERAKMPVNSCTRSLDSTGMSYIKSAKDGNLMGMNDNDKEMRKVSTSRHTHSGAS